jgi:1-acyl-sn-glycerol-3-phosphate acyltransferase
MRRAVRYLLDVVRTALLWVYFTLCYAFVVVPFYPLAWLLPGRPQRFIQRLNHLFFRGFFAWCRLLVPELSIHVADDVRAIRSSVLVCNHLSYLDPILLVSIFEKHSTIMKSGFLHVPLFGWVLRRSGYLSFDPRDAGLVDTIGEINEFLRDGGNLFVFPEGSRSRDGTIGRFAKGAFDIAKRCGAPVEALFIRGTGALYPCDRFRFDTCNAVTISVDRIATVSADEWAQGATAQPVTERVQASFEKHAVTEHRSTRPVAKGRGLRRALIAALVAIVASLVVPMTSTRLHESRTATAPARPGAVAPVDAFGKTVDDLVAAAIAEQKLPGCVVTVGRREGVLFQKAYGVRAIEPERVPMTEDTLFDLASLTKPIATATSVMILADRDQVKLDAPAARYVPGLARAGKGTITVRQLLTHVSGLPAETPVDDYSHGYAVALGRITAAKPLAAPGTKLVYSDAGFLVLQALVEIVTHRDLGAFAGGEIFGPLGMSDTGFVPSAALKERAAPSAPADAGLVKGEVHDPRALRLGGVAGHAGLFSTARDLSRYAQAILGEGEIGGVRILSKKSVREMLAPHNVPGGIRALGWDVQSRMSLHRGETLSRRAVGHGGYTGTTLWIDPESDLFVIFLSNRLYPDAKGSINALAGRIATVAGERFGPPADPPPATGGRIELGIDVLRRGGFTRLKGARVGLVTNASGRASDGARTADLLAHAPEVTLVALLAPEHGLSADREGTIDGGTDEATGLPVRSLYAEGRAPDDAAFEGIDTLVVDVQDVGARFFTYASTVHQAMQAAARLDIRVVVLDRPNPIDGVDVAGPLPTKSERSFVNHHRLPVRHGMTLGEIALMIDADQHLGTKLEVVGVRGWQRAQYFDQTGLDWVAPSPNLRSVAEAVLYPGVALLEGTNVSVGRGTGTPFEVVGAPWIDERLATTLQAAGLTGITFSRAGFTPVSGPHARHECFGVRLEVTDRAAFEPVRTGIAIALALRTLYADAWHTDKLGEIIGSDAVTSAILDGRPLADIEALWKTSLEAFVAKRKKYLLYADPNAGADAGAGADADTAR